VKTPEQHSDSDLGVTEVKRENIEDIILVRADGTPVAFATDEFQGKQQPVQ